MRFLLLLSVSVSAHAATFHAIDQAPSGPIVDGYVSPGEYMAADIGINDGFGGSFGQAVLGIDSTSDNMIQLGMDGMPTDFITIYVDSGPGGYEHTAWFEDRSDPHRAATSGTGFYGMGGSTISFAPGFAADAAITCGDSICVVFGLENMALSYRGHFDYDGFDALEVELRGEWLGLKPGTEMRFMATMGNPYDRAGYYRSNEFHGVSQDTVRKNGGNLAFSGTELREGDYNSFRTWCADWDFDGACDEAFGSFRSGDNAADAEPTSGGCSHSGTTGLGWLALLVLPLARRSRR